VRGSRDTVDHIPGHNFHEDLCNAACGAIVYAAKTAANQPYLGGPIISGGQFDTPIPDPQPAAEQQQAAVTFDQLSQQRDLLASQRDRIEQQRKRAATSYPVDRVQLETLTAELAVVYAEQQRVDTAMAKADRPRATGSTTPYLEWINSGGDGGPPGGWTRRERF
jgi:hypothetical protein